MNLRDIINNKIIYLIRTMTDDARRERERDVLDEKITYALEKLNAFDQYQIMIKNGTNWCKRELSRYHRTQRNARDERRVKDLINMAGRYLDNPMQEVRQPPNPRIPYDHINKLPDLWPHPPSEEAVRAAKTESKEWQRTLLDQVRRFGDRKLQERVEKQPLQRKGDFYSPCFAYHKKWNCQIANKRKCKQIHGCLPCFYILKEDNRDHTYGPACEVYHIKRNMDRKENEERERIARNIDRKSTEAQERRERERPHEKDLRYKLEKEKERKPSEKVKTKPKTTGKNKTNIAVSIRTLQEQLIETQSKLIKLQGKRANESNSDSDSDSDSSQNTTTDISNSEDSDSHEGNFKRQKTKKDKKKGKPKKKRQKRNSSSSGNDTGKDDPNKGERPTSPPETRRALRRPNPTNITVPEPIPSTSHDLTPHDPTPVAMEDTEAEIAKLLKSDDEEMNVVSIEGGSSPQNLPPAKDPTDPKNGNTRCVQRKESDTEAINLHVTSQDLC